MQVHKNLCIFLTGGAYAPYAPCVSTPLLCLPSSMASDASAAENGDDDGVAGGELATGVERTSAPDESVVELMMMLDLRNATGGDRFLPTFNKRAIYSVRQKSIP